MYRFITRALPVIVGVATLSSILVAVRAEELGVQRGDAAGMAFFSVFAGLGVSAVCLLLSPFWSHTGKAVAAIAFAGGVSLSLYAWTSEEGGAAVTYIAIHVIWVFGYGLLIPLLLGAIQASSRPSRRSAPFSS